MRESIHAGGGGEVRREVQSDLGIKDDELGEQTRQENDRAPLCPGEGDYGTAADFAAGASGSGNANAPGQAAPIVVEIEFGEPEVGFFDEEATGFADIKRAATAEGDNGIAPGRQEGFPGIDDVLLGRVAVNPVEKFPGAAEILAAESGLEGIEGLGLEEAGIGDDEGFTRAHLLEARGQFRDGAGAKNGRRRE